MFGLPYETTGGRLIHLNGCYVVQVPVNEDLHLVEKNKREKVLIHGADSNPSPAKFTVLVLEVQNMYLNHIPDTEMTFLRVGEFEAFKLEKVC